MTPGRMLSGGVMGSLAVDPGPICLRHGFAEDHLDSCLESLDALRDEGLVTVEGRRQIEVNPDARVLTRLAAAAFDRYFDMASIQPARHARAI